MSDLTSKTVEELFTWAEKHSWEKEYPHSQTMSGYCAASGELARRLEEAQQKIAALEIEGPHTPCRCVSDGDDGTLAHLCGWHERWIVAHDAEVAAKALKEVINDPLIIIDDYASWSRLRQKAAEYWTKAGRKE